MCSVCSIVDLDCTKLFFSWAQKSCYETVYRSGTVNSNTVNSKFHLIRSFFEIFANSYHFMFMHG